MHDDALPKPYSLGLPIDHVQPPRHPDPPAGAARRSGTGSSPAGQETTAAGLGGRIDDAMDIGELKLADRRTQTDAAAVCPVVLYIEDRPVNLKLMHGIFALWPNRHLETAGTSAAGLERIRNEQPDLLLIDDKVIDLDGADVLRQIRSDPQTESLPIMVISSDAHPERAVELLNLGVNEYLLKPFDIDHFGYLVAALTGPELLVAPPTRSPHEPGSPPPPRERRDRDRRHRRPPT